MIYIIAILALAVIILLARLLYMKYEMKDVTKQLKLINKNKSDNKVVCGLLSKDFEELTAAINNNIEIRKQCEASRIRTENALKSAIADISHDLRTPLTSVIGYLQFMKLDNTTAEERIEYLEVAYQRAKALESLLNDFYTLSLIDSAEYEMKLEKISLTKVLRELLVDRYGEFTFRNLEISFQIPEENVYIIADGRSVERIIENLLSNALKYAKDRIEISLVAEGDKIALMMGNNVERDDNVTSLNNEDLERIFDRFYRADNTRSGQGTGLGLAITKSLMEKMGGEIRVLMSGDILSIQCEFKGAH